MNNTPKTRLEELLSTRYPLIDGLKYTKHASVSSVERIGSFCNNVFFLWLSSPRNEEEKLELSQSDVQEARCYVSDIRTGVLVLSALTIGALVTKDIM